jgi:redox-sensitive bicupin YhaK (pirin superfamily)
MSLTRRAFLAGSAAFAAACRTSIAARVPRRVVELWTGRHAIDGAGVRLLRIFPRAIDPFVLLDRFHSEDPADYVAGFPDHPHRGFETVTVMLAGRVHHRDSRGHSGDIVGGGAQWMTAGRGIVHSEMPPRQPGLLSGYQLWLNLPAREKMRAQEYQDLAPERLAHGALSAGGSLSLIAGKHDGLVGPVAPRATEPLLFTARLEDDRPLLLDLPSAHQAFVFVSDGLVEVGGTTVPAGTLALLSPGNRLELRALSSSGVFVAAARPLGEPIVQSGPFVMNTAEEIRQAWDDYRNGRLG